MEFFGRVLRRNQPTIWETVLRRQDIELNPPVIELTYPNDGSVYPRIEGEPKIEYIKRCAIIIPDQHTTNRQNGTTPICFTVYR